MSDVTVSAYGVEQAMPLFGTGTRIGMSDVVQLDRLDVCALC